MIKKLLLLAVCGVVAGCNQVAYNEYDRSSRAYYDLGMQAEERVGDLSASRDYYLKAVTDAHRGNAGPAFEAYPRYEWARISGYMGNFDDAEKGFQESLHLIKAADSTAAARHGHLLLAPALCEYARLLHDTGRHAEAVDLYRQAVDALAEFKVDQRDPLGYADFLDEYADSLRATGDADKAESCSGKAKALRAENKDRIRRQLVRHYNVKTTP